MSNRNFIIRLLGAALMTAAVATACQEVSAIVPIVKLASLESEITLEPEAGSFDIDFYANSSYHIEYLNDNDWLTLTATDPVDEMAVLTGTYTQNDGFKRRVDFVLCSDLDTRRDTVVVKQKAFEDAFISFGESSVTLPGAGGVSEETVQTNVDFSEMTVDITYSDAGNVDWITGLEIEDSDSDERTMRITLDQNTDEIAPRSALVFISFTDGWGDVVSIYFNILQCNANETGGEVISFEDFRSRYVTGETIEDYVQLNGYIVSNPASLNAGEPTQSTSSSIDFTPPTVTVYFESEDGKYGVALVTTDEDENVFEQYDHVGLLLHGAVADLVETDPACYEITGVDRSMIFSRTSGTAEDLPLKRKSISELTDDDIYTYVRLTDVEIPIRKGSLMPVEQGFTSAANSQMVPKFPLLVIDSNGDDIYLMTNDRCPYRLDGTRLPYGSGSMGGVIVHEHYSRFEWREGADISDMETDETLGYIGRYQIRHQTKDDIWGDMEDSVEDGFAALLCEYRYVNPDTVNKVLKPSYGTNGWLDHTYTAQTWSAFGGLHMSEASYAYDYLGPCGSNVNWYYGLNYGNKNGCGIVLDLTEGHDTYNTDYEDRVSFNPDGTVEWCGPYAANEYVAEGTGGWVEDPTNVNQINYQSSSLRGHGMCPAGCMLAVTNFHWWDYDNDRPYAWLINFSTEGISTSSITMQLSVMNRDSGYVTPRYWCAEWSFTNSQAEEDDDQWNMIGEYTVQDATFSSSPNIYSVQGYKGVNFKLPTDILGHDNVYIRLRPTCDLGGSVTYQTYAGCHFSDSTPYSSDAVGVYRNPTCLGYFAIRYNK
ncbi:MAG: hypothetical protein LUD50_07440 [Clostridia bacterium]|nr:hypothetical protein [Clostridia bacterium]